MLSGRKLQFYSENKYADEFSSTKLADYPLWFLIKNIQTVNKNYLYMHIINVNNFNSTLLFICMFQNGIRIHTLLKDTFNTYIVHYKSYLVKYIYVHAIEINITKKYRFLLAIIQKNVKYIKNNYKEIDMLQLNSKKDILKNIFKSKDICICIYKYQCDELI